MSVPFVDLALQYAALRSEIDDAVAGVLRHSRFIGGEEVRAFEAEFAAFVGTEHVVGCANGTDAIEILLEALGVGSGDEVLVPALTWISTSEAVSRVGATPVFVDVDRHGTIDVDVLGDALTSRTKAVIPVHLYGHPADMDGVMAFAKEHGLLVLEDCAQAHGARWRERPVGTFGDAASFSFYPGKNLGAFGDAGCMVTWSEEVATRARRIANHGQLGRKHDHAVEGRNSRLDTLQAAVLRVKLRRLDAWNQARRAHAAAYTGLLEGTGVAPLGERPGAESVYHLFVVLGPDRDALREHMTAQEIGAGVHYPRALPDLECYASRSVPREAYRQATRIASNGLSLPMFPELTRAQIEEVVRVIRDHDV